MEVLSHALALIFVDPQQLIEFVSARALGTWKAEIDCGNSADVIEASGVCRGGEGLLLNVHPGNPNRAKDYAELAPFHSYTGEMPTGVGVSL